MNANAGGVVVLNAADDVVITQELRAFGRWFDGGTVIVDAGDDVLLDYQPGTGMPKGEIVVEGRSLSGFGGTVSISAGDSVALSGPIRGSGGVNNGGGESLGGSLEIEAGCGGLVIDDVVELTGGLADGGLLVAYAAGPVSIHSTIDLRATKLGGNGGIVLASTRQRLVMSATASIKVDGHNTSTAGENGQGGVVVLQACELDIEDTGSAGAVVTATGHEGGLISFGGAKMPLPTAGYSVRVGDKALVSADGDFTDGSILLEVTQSRAGSCSNNPSIACSLSAQCPGTGQCLYANPDTQGKLTQFVPGFTTQQVMNLLPCLQTCL